MPIVNNTGIHIALTMKNFIIEWDILRNGEFPIQLLENCGFSIATHKSSIFKMNVMISPKGDEDLSPALIFEIGLLVGSSLHVIS